MMLPEIQSDKRQDNIKKCSQKGSRNAMGAKSSVCPVGSQWN